MGSTSSISNMLERGAVRIFSEMTNLYIRSCTGSSQGVVILNPKKLLNSDSLSHPFYQQKNINQKKSVKPSCFKLKTLLFLVGKRSF